MNRPFLFSAAFLLIYLITSCVPVQVNKGPFEISQDRDLTASKMEYIESVREQLLPEKCPNIVLILADDLSKFDISVYSDSGVQVPNMERIASEGAVFSRAFTSSPVCSPSRAALLTGRYQQRFGFERQPMNRYARSKMEYRVVRGMVDTEPMRLLSPMADVPIKELKNQGIPESELLISEIMQAAGYETALCGKWHLGNYEPFEPYKRGFGKHYGFYEAFTLYSPLDAQDIHNYRHDYFANKHIWKQERKGSCAIRMNGEIISEEEYLTFAIARESVRFMRENKDRPFFLVSAFNAPHTPFQAPESYYNMFADIKDENKRTYYAMIAALDDAIGTIMNEITELGIDENTIIILTSDNGGATYTGATDNGPLRGGKFTQFEGGINVPLLMKWNGRIDPGIEFSGQVSLLDLFPTLVNACNIEIPPGLIIDGSDLVTRLSDPDGNKDEYLFWRTDYNKAVRSDKWKLIWNTRDDTYHLFDVSNDNFEQVNLAGEFPEVVRSLKKRFVDWEMQMKPPMWPGLMEIWFETGDEISWWAI